MRKAALLYYVYPGDRMGNVVRALTIANRLVDRFRVTMIIDGELPPGIAVSPRIEFVKSPSLGSPVDHTIVGAPRKSSDETATRRELLLDRFSRLKPGVVLIDTFPFGDGRVDEELIPVLEAGRAESSKRPLVVCSLTNMLTGNHVGRDDRIGRMAALLDDYFDAVLVHSDPTFARLEEFFQPKSTSSPMIYHTGFVLRARPRAPLPGNLRQQQIVVSAGGGKVGGPLFRAAVEAHRLIWDANRLPMTIITGPLLPEDEYQSLKDASQRSPAITLKRSMPDPGALLADSTMAVCHCGYNTAIDVIHGRVAALLVPVGEFYEAEQVDRAQRMVHWGLGRMLMPHHLNGATVASGIHQLTRFSPSETSLNLDGAEISANLIYHLSVSEDVGSVLPATVSPLHPKQLH